MDKKRHNHDLKSHRKRKSRFDRESACKIHIEERDEQILTDLFLQRLMSREQIERLHFSSTVRCNARLRLLFDNHFVSRHYPAYAPYGAQALYSVGKAALAIVARRLDMDLPEVARFYRRTQSPTFIEHTLATVDIWLKCREAAMSHAELDLELWLAELQCRHEWEIRASGGSWRKESFKPDAFMRLGEQKGTSHDFFIEVDLGHTSSQQFKGKLLMHQRYRESGLFTETFGNRAFRTLVITTGERRLQNLRALSSQQQNTNFLFTTFDRINADSIFGQVWEASGLKNCFLWD